MSESPHQSRKPRFPYPGIRPFHITESVDESVIFHGRSDHTNELVDRLSDSHMVAVLGPSGSGKSSLVRVGLIPTLERGFVWKAGERWLTSQMEPGEDPIGRLAHCVHQAIEGVYELDGVPPGSRLEPSAWSVESLKLRFEDPKRPDALVDFFEFSGFETGTNILILVDQFEELFRRDFSNEKVARQFIDLLLNVFNNPPEGLYIVLTMRSDNLEECALYRGLPEALNKTSYLLPRMNDHQLRDAITTPARDFGGVVKPDLVDRLVDEIAGENVRYDQDSMALLQHALLRLWLHESDRRKKEPGKIELTLDQFEKFGGLAGSLSGHADQLFSALDDHQQAIAERMLRLLSVSSEQDRYSRRFTTPDEIARVGVFERDDIDPVLRVFEDERVSFIRSKGRDRIDVTHESFIRKWEKFREISNRERQSAKEYLDLAQRAHSKGGTEYLTNPALARFQNWWRDRKPQAREAEIWMERVAPGGASLASYADTRKFLKKSASAATRAKVWKFAVVALLVVGVLTSWLAYEIDGEFRRSEGELWSMKAQAQPDPLRAQLGSLAAQIALLADPVRIPPATMKELHRITYLLTKESSLIGGGLSGWSDDHNGLTRFLQGKPPVAQVAVGESFAATATVDGTIRLWSLATGRHHDEVVSQRGDRPHVVFGPNGELGYGTNQMYGYRNVDDGNFFVSNQGTVDLAFVIPGRSGSAGGRPHLLTAWTSGVLEIRRSAGMEPASLKLEGSKRVTLASSGELAFVQDDLNAKVIALKFDAANPRRDALSKSETPLEISGAGVKSVAVAEFHPVEKENGQREDWLTIAMGNTVTVRRFVDSSLAEMSSGKMEFDNRVASVAVDARGETLAVGLADGRVEMAWLRIDEEAKTVQIDIWPVTCPAPKGNVVLSGVFSTEHLNRPVPQPFTAVAVAFGKRSLFVGGPDDGLAEYSVTESGCTKLRDFAHHSSQVIAAAYDGSSETLFTLGEAGGLIGWKDGHAQYVEGAEKPAVDTEPLIAAGGMLLLAEESGDIAFWRVSRHGEPKRLSKAKLGRNSEASDSQRDFIVHSMAFVPNSRVTDAPDGAVMVSYKNGAVYEWNLADESPREVRPPQSSQLSNFAFSESGGVYLAIARERDLRYLVVCQIDTGEEKKVANMVLGSGPVATATFGNRLIMAGDWHHIRVVKVPDSINVEVVKEYPTEEVGGTRGKARSSVGEFQRLHVVGEHLFLNQNTDLIQYWRLEKSETGAVGLADRQELPVPRGVVSITRAGEVEFPDFEGVENVEGEDTELTMVQTISSGGEVAYFGPTPRAILAILDEQGADKAMDTRACDALQKHTNNLTQLGVVWRSASRGDEHLDALWTRTVEACEPQSGQD